MRSEKQLIDSERGCEVEVYKRAERIIKRRVNQGYMWPKSFCFIRQCETKKTVRRLTRNWKKKGAIGSVPGHTETNVIE
jgi:hypothetical protein